MFFEASSSELLTVERFRRDDKGIAEQLTNQVSRQYTDDTCRRDRGVAKDLAANSTQTSSAERYDDSDGDPAVVREHMHPEGSTTTYSKTFAYNWLLAATKTCIKDKKVAPRPAIHMSKKDPPKARGQMSADKQNASAHRVKGP